MGWSGREARRGGRGCVYVVYSRFDTETTEEERSTIGTGGGAFFVVMIVMTLNSTCDSSPFPSPPSSGSVT